MIEPTNDASLPWAVLVERVDIQPSKGAKFYSGAPSAEAAQELADARNAEQPAQGPRFSYTVVPESHEVVQALRRQG